MKLHLHCTLLYPSGVAYGVYGPPDADMDRFRKVLEQSKKTECPLLLTDADFLLLAVGTEPFRTTIWVLGPGETPPLNRFDWGDDTVAEGSWRDKPPLL